MTKVCWCRGCKLLNLGDYPRHLPASPFASISPRILSVRSSWIYSWWARWQSQWITQFRAAATISQSSGNGCVRSSPAHTPAQFSHSLSQYRVESFHVEFLWASLCLCSTSRASLFRPRCLQPWGAFGWWPRNQLAGCVSRGLAWQRSLPLLASALQAYILYWFLSAPWQEIQFREDSH